MSRDATNHGRSTPNNNTQHNNTRNNIILLLFAAVGVAEVIHRE